MPLHPQADALLEQMREAGVRPFEELSVAEAREAAWGYVALAGEPQEVADVRTTLIPGPTADIPIRIYTPEGGGPRGGIVFFHGSGWVIANIDICDAGRAVAGELDGLRRRVGQLPEGPRAQVPGAVRRLLGGDRVGGRERRRPRDRPRPARGRGRQRGRQPRRRRLPQGARRGRPADRLPGPRLPGARLQLGHAVVPRERRGLRPAARDDALVLEPLRHESRRTRTTRSSPRCAPPT